MNWNNAAFAAYPFAISAKGSVWQENPELGQEAGKEFSKLFLQVFEKNKEPEREIRQCIARWPDNAYFKFLLAECVHRRDAAEGDRILESMMADHPDALFSRAIQLRRYLTRDAPLPGFVGDGLFPELNEYYPERVSFHPFEVYFLEHNIHLAAMKLQIAANDSERHWRYPYLKQGDLQLAIWEHDSPEAFFETHSMGFYDDEDYDEDDDYEDDEDEDEDPEKVARRLRLMDRLMQVQTTDPPRFALSATEALYGTSIMLTEHQMQDLLAQYRALLIPDLERVLDDAVVRYKYFYNLGDENFASLHAFILLCHFQSTASLPTLFNFLSQPEEVVEWWLGDILSQNVSQWLTPFLHENVAVLDPLILNSDAYEFARITGLSALEQFALHWPERKTEVEDHLLALLEAMNDPDRDSFGLETMNGYLVTVAAVTKMERLFAAMKPLFDADKVSAVFIADWQDAEQEFERPLYPSEIYPLHVDDLGLKYTEGLRWTVRE